MKKLNKKDREKVMTRLLGGFDVICYDEFTVERSLTVGKTYSVLEVQKSAEYTFYKIKCDTRRTKWMSAEFFNPNKKRREY